MSELQQIKLYATRPHDCSYFKDRLATTVFVDPDIDINNIVYTQLSQRGFRRSGQHLYRPQCQNCEQCIASRIPVSDFAFSRSQRRILNRNSDLRVEVKRAPDPSAYRLYERYINQRHQDGDMYPASVEQYESFINDGHDSTEFRHFYLDERLLGIAVSDVLLDGLSAIYTFYDPDETRRSLGSFAILEQIQNCAERGLPYLYLGYWIRDCDKMRYKTNYRPIELLIKNQWLLLN
ncbi:arginyltransferase [Spongiibacter sp. KMU-158]|uniref:Aspartate/glutamate leucyltransferase n=1 Tax=Spongiibacter pelagi TaxID=2760804 RepID=A0A927C1Z0_9GAMM|nr:arginyltransferase [Spongiibacter pelagi]MBD2859254.1 arginyltransferase [Spongiibacter pelagi]